MFARGAVRVDPRIGEAGDVDTAVTVLTHEDGTLTTIDNSREAVYGFDQRIEAFGNGGMAVSDNPARHAGWHVGREARTGEPLPWFFLDRYARVVPPGVGRVPHLPGRGRPVAGRHRRRAALHRRRARRRPVAPRGPAGPGEGDRVTIEHDRGHWGHRLRRRHRRGRPRGQGARRGLPGPPRPGSGLPVADPARRHAGHRVAGPRSRRLRRRRAPGDLQRLPRHVRRPEGGPGRLRRADPAGRRRGQPDGGPGRLRLERLGLRRHRPPRRRGGAAEPGQLLRVHEGRVRAGGARARATPASWPGSAVSRGCTRPRSPARGRRTSASATS